MALDIQKWTVIASNLSDYSVKAIHDGLTNVATNDRAEFDAHSDFREQTDIFEAELNKRSLSFVAIP